MSRIRLALAVTAFSIVASSCNNQTAPSGVTLTASPASITPGAVATLTWTAITDATSCSIDNNIGVVPCNGSSKTVEPASTTTYTLTASGSGGSKTATATVTVSTNPTPTATPTPAGTTTVAPTMGTFIATPATIAAGASTMLSWKGIVNADHCLIDHDIGLVSCADSSISVTPAGAPPDTAIVPYTLTAVGISASVSATVRVTVTPR